MSRTHRAPVATAIVLLSASLTAAGPAPDIEGMASRVEELATLGLGEAAPTEIEIARTFIEAARSQEAGSAELVEAQLGLLEAMEETRGLEAAALESERLALDAEMEADTEKEAYEFVVEQILASGVAAFWSAP